MPKMIAYSTEAFHHPNYHYSNQYKSISHENPSKCSPSFSSSLLSPSSTKSISTNKSQGTESVTAPYIFQVYTKQQEYLKTLIKVSTVKEKERLQKLKNYNLLKEDINLESDSKKKLSNTQSKNPRLEREKEYLKHRELERKKRHKMYEERFEVERAKERELIENAKTDIKVLLQGIAKQYYHKENNEEEAVGNSQEIEKEGGNQKQQEDDDMMSPPRVKNATISDQYWKGVVDENIKNKLALNRDVYQNIPCKVDSNNIYSKASKELCISPRTGINVHTWEPRKRPMPKDGIYMSMSDDRNIEYDTRSYRLKKIQWNKYENPQYGKPKPERGLYDEEHCRYMTTNKIKEKEMKEEQELVSMKQNVERRLLSREKELKALEEMWLKSYDM